MDGVRATVNNKKLVFGTNGDLVDSTGAAEVVKGKWTAASAKKKNEITYTVEGANQPPLAAVYKFNKRNQLQVAVVVGGTETAAFTYPGRIEVDSNHNFTYFVIDADGNDTGVAFVLYGDIEFAEDTVNLTVALADGSETSIAGASGIQSLETAKNHTAGFDADDLLTFHAKTVNVFPGVAEPVTKPALLDFVGSWDVQQGTLVFVSQIKSAPGSRSVSLGFAGKFKAVTAGFVYFADANGTKAVLNLRGRHVYKGGKGDFAWQTVIGFTETSFDAKVTAKASTVNASGQGLTIEGTLGLKGGQNTALSFDLKLEARYEFQAGFLVFKADISNGIQPSYDLMLAGAFKYSNLNLTFEINYSNAANAKKLTVVVGVQGNRDSMIKHVALMLDISESEAKLKLELTLEAKIVLKNGVRVKEVAA
jgi:hypothetical protein